MTKTIFIFIIGILFYSCDNIQDSKYLVDFESPGISPVFQYFANGHLSESRYKFKIIENPKPRGANSPKGKVGEIIKASDGLTYAGITADLPAPIDLSLHTKINVRVLVDHSGTFSVKLEKSEAGGPNIVQTLPVNKANEWQNLTFDFSGNIATGHKYYRLTLFTDLHQKATGEDVTTYFDEIKHWGKGGKSAFDIELKKGFRVVVLGSSTSRGAGASVPDSAWVKRYKKYLTDIDKNNQVVNLAVGGYTTYHLLPTHIQIPEGKTKPDTFRNVTAALKFKPDAVIINLGSNDTSRDYPIKEQLTNFNLLFKTFSDKNIPVWISTTQPRNYEDEKRKMQRIMKDSMSYQFGEYSINFWDGIATDDFSIKEELNCGDGIHLNDAGHRILAKRVIDMKIYEITMKSNMNKE